MWTAVCQHAAVYQSRRQFRWRRWSLQHCAWTMLFCCCLNSRLQPCRLQQVTYRLNSGLYLFYFSLSDDCNHCMRNGRRFRSMIIITKTHRYASFLPIIIFGTGVFCCLFHSFDTVGWTTGKASGASFTKHHTSNLERKLRKILSKEMQLTFLGKLATNFHITYKKLWKT